MTILGARSAGITSSRTTSQSRTQAKGTPLQRDGSDSGTHAPGPWACQDASTEAKIQDGHGGDADGDVVMSVAWSTKTTMIAMVKPTREDNPDTKPHDVVFGARDSRGRRRPATPSASVELKANDPLFQVSVPTAAPMGGYPEPDHSFNLPLATNETLTSCSRLVPDLEPVGERVSPETITTRRGFQSTRRAPGGGNDEEDATSTLANSAASRPRCISGLWSSTLGAMGTSCQMPVPGDRRDAREQRATLESYLDQNQAGLRVSRRDDGLQDAHLMLSQFDARVPARTFARLLFRKKRQVGMREAQEAFYGIEPGISPARPSRTGLALVGGDVDSERYEGSARRARREEPKVQHGRWRSLRDPEELRFLCTCPSPGRPPTPRRSSR
ncbi:hypothetical protein PG984_002684 [Apiospora sp. TS-2023a]